MPVPVPPAIPPTWLVLGSSTASSLVGTSDAIRAEVSYTNWLHGFLTDANAGASRGRSFELGCAEIAMLIRRAN
jgi:hypothetical protein